MSLTIENHFYSRICEFNANFAMHFRQRDITKVEKIKQLLASPFFLGSLCLFLIATLPILKEISLIDYYLSILLMCSLSLGVALIADKRTKQSTADKIAVKMGYKNQSSHLSDFDRNLLHSFCSQNQLYFEPIGGCRMRFINLYQALSENLISFNPEMPSLTVNTEGVMG